MDEECKSEDRISFTHLAWYTVWLSLHRFVGNPLEVEGGHLVDQLVKVKD